MVRRSKSADFQKPGSRPRKTGRSPHVVQGTKNFPATLTGQGVIHDIVGVEDAAKDLEEIVKKPPLYRLWVVVFMYGLASVCVGRIFHLQRSLTIAFAFGARWIDTPIAFILGVILALLQLVVAKQSMLYSNVFEISASIITAFLARAFGSIPPRGLFCFSSLTASSIALILPGYIVRMSRSRSCFDMQSWDLWNCNRRILSQAVFGCCTP